MASRSGGFSTLGTHGKVSLMQGDAVSHVGSKRPPALRKSIGRRRSKAARAARRRIRARRR